MRSCRHYFIGVVLRANAAVEYRVDSRVEDHRHALVHALESGCNLIDTSSNYAEGYSERLVGDVLHSDFFAKKRSEIVVVTKVGYVLFK